MLPSSRLVRNLDGVSTEVLLQTYADRVLVLITQLGKVGNLIQATIPATTPLLPIPPSDPSEPNIIPLPPPPPSLELTFLLGSAPSERLRTLQSLYASQVATLIWTSEAEGSLDVDRRGVIVGIALRQTADGGRDGELNEREKVVFRGVMDMVRELLKQS